MRRTALLAVAALTLAVAIAFYASTNDAAPAALSPPGPRVGVEPPTPAARPSVEPKLELQPAAASVPAAPEPDPEGPATVVAITDGDVVPEPERLDAPPPDNDPIEPELPQTAEWRREKTERIATVVARHVERLEQELATARARADADEVRRLEVRLARYRERDRKLAESLRAQ